MTIQLEVPYLAYEQIANVAYRILRKLNCESIIPVPIEEIIEFHFGIDIIPIPELLNIFEIDGWTSSDLKTINVDDFIYKHRENRYRFTLAHELGHVVLHKKIFNCYNFNKIEEWKCFYNEVDETSYSWLESQAYNFAGLILVPPIYLKKYFEELIAKYKSSFESAVYRKLPKNKYQDYFIDVASVNLSTIFNVSTEVISRRIEKDNLTRLIP